MILLYVIVAVFVLIIHGEQMKSNLTKEHKEIQENFPSFKNIKHLTCCPFLSDAQKRM